MLTLLTMTVFALAVVGYCATVDAVLSAVRRSRARRGARRRLHI